MLRTVVAVLVVLWAGHAGAQTCPEFFRFVDFGLQDRDGELQRGGPIFRAESFDGAPLLLAGQTACLDLRDVAKDGPGNPIPIVTSITYDPAQIGMGLRALRVFAVPDTARMADQTAAAHRTGVARAGATVARGPNFLCSSAREQGTLSCQVVSPYPGNAALVVYCDTRQCTMPGMAINDRLMIDAVWPSRAALVGDAGTAGPDILDKVQQIHDFLNPLSSGL